MTRGMETHDPKFGSPVNDHTCTNEQAEPAPQPATPVADATCAAPAPVPRWRPAKEPTCCGSGCDDCPF